MARYLSLLFPLIMATMLFPHSLLADGFDIRDIELDRGSFRSQEYNSAFHSVNYSEDDAMGRRKRAQRKLFNDIGNAAENMFSDAVHIYSAPSRISTTDALWLGGIIAAGGIIYIYDQEIYDIFQRNRNSDAMKEISEAGEFFDEIGHGGRAAKYYIAILAFGYVSGIDKLVQIPAEILESYYVAGLIKVAANRLLGRRRPNEGLGPRYFEFNGGTSFPSGHAANVSQVATILSRHIDFLPFTIAAYTAVGTVCVERLTSESHWPSDVYFAVVYGWAVSNEIFRLNHERRMNLQPAALGADNIPGLMISIKF
jgi:hypothetical protein